MTAVEDSPAASVKAEDVITYHPEAWRRYGETVGALLAARATSHGELPFIHLLDDAQGERTISFASLYAGARRVAAGLTSRGIGPGHRVVLILPTGMDFLETFFGVLLAGATAIPCYPPLRSRGLSDYQERLSRLLQTADPALIVTFGRIRLVVEASAFRAGICGATVEASALQADDTGWTAPGGDAEELALVQFSSGSTGTPRGVMLTHRNLLANVVSILDALQPGPEDVGCSWLPLYHDMGLIGCLVAPLYAGIRIVLMSPQGFLMDPKRWLWAIHRYRCAISTAPNFAYQVLATRLEEAELTGLDLSCWRVAMSGAEPVVPATLDAFAERYAQYGFKATALLPVYGMAEAALATVFPTVGRGPVIDAVDAQVLAATGRAEPVGEAPGRAASGFASVGRPLKGFDLRIVDAKGLLTPDRTVGEVQVRGPSLMKGYLKNPEATAAAFDDGWLRTGDLGYLADGDLYIVGRIKDQINKAGRKYIPQDLEQAAEGVMGVRRGCVVAFGVPDPATGTESVVVVAESRGDAARHHVLAQTIADRIQEAAGLRPDRIQIVPPGTVPKTSSGKLQRSRCRDLWLAGDWHAAVEPTVIDKTILVGQGLAQRLLRGGGGRLRVSRDV